jgi:hypothetical protein
MAALAAAITHGADHSGPVNQLDYPNGLTKRIKARTVTSSSVHNGTPDTTHAQEEP